MRSFLRYGTDVLLYRVLRFITINGDQYVRQIRLNGGGSLLYRLNRGDIRAIAETFTEEVYRLPLDEPINTLVDLGANIGIVTVWLARTYGVRRALAVEPLASNARLTRANLTANGIDGLVVEAAITAGEDWVGFDVDCRNSTIGRVSASGEIVVRGTSMESALARLGGPAGVDVLKLDIEGGEGALFEGDLGWLNGVRLIVAELHPNVVDIEPIVQSLRARGFAYSKLNVHGPDWLYGDIMALFSRDVAHTGSEAVAPER